MSTNPIQPDVIEALRAILRDERYSLSYADRVAVRSAANVLEDCVALFRARDAIDQNIAGKGYAVRVPLKDDTIVIGGDPPAPRAAQEPVYRPSPLDQFMASCGGGYKEPTPAPQPDAERGLAEEAEQLRAAFVGTPAESCLSSIFVEEWTRVARKAREIHRPRTVTIIKSQADTLAELDETRDRLIERSAETVRMGETIVALTAERDALKTERDIQDRRIGTLLEDSARYLGERNTAQRERIDARSQVATLTRERDDARRTAEYWKAEHLAGNAEIARLSSAPPAVTTIDEDALASDLSRMVRLTPIDEQTPTAIRALIEKHRREVAVEDVAKAIDSALASRSGTMMLGGPAESIAAAAARAALSAIGCTAAKTGDGQEVAWLIESAGPMWWCALPACSHWGPAGEAVRFARREDAERVARFINPNGGLSLKATEHAWVSHDSAPPSSAPPVAPTVALTDIERAVHRATAHMHDSSTHANRLRLILQDCTRTVGREEIAQWFLDAEYSSPRDLAEIVLRALGQPRAEAAQSGTNYVVPKKTPAPASAPSFVVDRERVQADVKKGLSATFRLGVIDGWPIVTIVNEVLDVVERQLRAQNTSTGAGTDTAGCEPSSGQGSVPASSPPKLKLDTSKPETAAVWAQAERSAERVAAKAREWTEGSR